MESVLESGEAKRRSGETGASLALEVDGRVAVWKATRQLG
jgi:hypothetical protein